MSKALRPDDVPQVLLEAMNAGDVEAVASVYQADGVVGNGRDDTLVGRDAIRSMVSGFLAQRPRFALRSTDVVQSGDVALVRTQWTIAMIDGGGKRMEFSVAPTLVVQRHPQDGWRIAIDRNSPTVASGRAVPILPAIDLVATRAFYETLGFTASYFSPAGERGYLIARRGDLELHVFSHPQLGSVENYAGCYWRVTDADAMHDEYARLGLPSSGAPSLGDIENRPWGMREFVLIDPNSNLIRIGHPL
jgi:uncharacterized protein (TIGR02246 family)